MRYNKTTYTGKKADQRLVPVIQNHTNGCVWNQISTCTYLLQQSDT